MERELQMLSEAQRLLRLVSNNLKEIETVEIRPLDIIRRDLNEFVRELQYTNHNVSEE